MGETLGYARVSTQQQILDRQLDALTAAGVKESNIYTDKISGAKNDRPGLTELLRYMRPGDTVVVAALDRLGRSLSGIIRTVEQLKERGVTLRSIKESIDTSTDVGEMLLGIFATLAQYERSLINERAQQAREAAKARGQHTGRPKALTAKQAALACRMRDTGESIATILETLEVSRSTLYRVFQAADAEKLAKVADAATA
jgi:DNA invertase Pin-like site-specific DNA recombinase